MLLRAQERPSGGQAGTMPPDAQDLAVLWGILGGLIRARPKPMPPPHRGSRPLRLRYSSVTLNP